MIINKSSHCRLNPNASINFRYSITHMSSITGGNLKPPKEVFGRFKGSFTIKEYVVI